MGIPGRSPNRLVGYTCQNLRYCVRANVRYIVRTNDAFVKRKFRPTALPLPRSYFLGRSSLDSMSDASQLQTALADHFRIERDLGRGGMATVYLAYDLRQDRQVALKVIRPELGAALGADRFLREIKVTAKLRHPHILPLFDSGDTNGQLWYTMPYVQGGTLRQR